MSTETTTPAETDTTPAPGTLTADDLAALRAARSIGFYRYNGETFIRAFLDNGSAILTVRQQRLFPLTPDYSNDRERRMSIPGRVSGYTEPRGMGMWNDQSEPAAELYALVYTYSDEVRTVLTHARPGDVLSFSGIGSNDTDNLRAAGLHCDELKVHLSRGGKVSTYLVEFRISPDNSARMIKRFGSPGIRKG